MPTIVVDVMPKPEVLDPQGKAIDARLPELGFREFSQVRQGKRFELTVEGEATADVLDRASDLDGGTAGKLHPKTTVAPDLADLAVVIIPGGFSYGDYLRAGALAATQPIMRLVQDAVEAKELTLIGLGNGFQVLTEAKL